MDYKYIEQLLDRYWNCDTSMEEEEILKSFFHQKDIPANMIQYKPLFVYQEAEKKVELGDDFDKKMLGMIEKPVVKARKLTIYRRLSPLFKAAAMIVVLFSFVFVTQKSMDRENSLIYVYDQYKGNNSDPQVAYDLNSPIDSINKIVKDQNSNIADHD